MSFADTWAMSQDEDLRHRIVACCALEQIPAPEWWERDHHWQIVARTDWADAYAYAQASGNDRPGLDAAVITDGMILSAVQTVRGAS